MRRLLLLLALVAVAAATVVPAATTGTKLENDGWKPARSAALVAPTGDFEDELARLFNRFGFGFDLGSAAVVKRAVTFTVNNVNRSNLACATDGRPYKIRGEIVGPRSFRRSDDVTLYLHGLELGKFFWTLDDLSGTSFVERQARDGHVSVVIDRLGYDTSGKPNGFQSCLGGQADIANQIVDQLRDGSYSVKGTSAAPSFSKVVLGGHSVGGLLSILTAHSFDNVDGIIVASYSDTVLSDAARQAAAANAAICQAGGWRTEGGDFPGGYAPFAPTLAAFRAGFFVSTPAELVDEVGERRNLNPCGDTGTFMAAAQTNVRFIGEIGVPVLVIIGREDALFPPPAGPTQASLFTGTDDVTLVQLSPSGHSVTTEQPRAEFSEAISDWLGDHGFGSRRG